MHHYVVLLRRRPELSFDAFLAAWLGEHRRLALQLPGLVDARFLPASLAPIAGEPAAADGLGLLTFATREDMDDALASEPAAALRAHTATLAVSDAATRLIVQDPDD